MAKDVDAVMLIDSQAQGRDGGRSSPTPPRACKLSLTAMTLLACSHWRGASMRELVHSQLAHLVENGGPQVTVFRLQAPP
jgi:hypothetical protein